MQDALEEAGVLATAGAIDAASVISATDAMVIAIGAVTDRRALRTAWRLARRSGAPVLGVCLDGESPTAAWLEGIRVFRFKSELKELLAALNTASPTRAVPDMTSSLPTTYLPRTAELARAREALLAARPTCVSIVGLGGIAKTVLAQALCQDEQVMAAYPDGTRTTSARAGTR